MSRIRYEPSPLTASSSSDSATSTIGEKAVVTRSSPTKNWVGFHVRSSRGEVVELLPVRAVGGEIQLSDAPLLALPPGRSTTGRGSALQDLEVHALWHDRAPLIRPCGGPMSATLPRNTPCAATTPSTSRAPCTSRRRHSPRDVGRRSQRSRTRDRPAHRQRHRLTSPESRDDAGSFGRARDETRDEASARSSATEVRTIAVCLRSPRPGSRVSIWNALRMA